MSNYFYDADDPRYRGCSIFMPSILNRRRCVNCDRTLEEHSFHKHHSVENVFDVDEVNEEAKPKTKIHWWSMKLSKNHEFGEFASPIQRRAQELEDQGYEVISVTCSDFSKWHNIWSIMYREILK